MRGEAGSSSSRTSSPVAKPGLATQSDSTSRTGAWPLLVTGKTVSRCPQRTFLIALGLASFHFNLNSFLPDADYRCLQLLRKWITPYPPCRPSGCHGGTQHFSRGLHTLEVASQDSTDPGQLPDEPVNIRLGMTPSRAVSRRFAPEIVRPSFHSRTPARRQFLMWSFFARPAPVSPPASWSLSSTIPPPHALRSPIPTWSGNEKIFTVMRSVESWYVQAGILLILGALTGRVVTGKGHSVTGSRP